MLIYRHEGSSSREQAGQPSTLTVQQVARKQVTRPARRRSLRSPYPKRAGKFRDYSLWEVERIVGAIYGEGCQWVLVKWKNWDDTWNYWERASKMGRAKQVLQDFYAVNGKPSHVHPKVMTAEGLAHERYNFKKADDNNWSYLDIVESQVSSKEKDAYCRSR